VNFPQNNALSGNLGELGRNSRLFLVDYVWNVMAHEQKPNFVFKRKGQVHFNRRGRQFSRLLATEVCTSAVVMLDTPCSEVVWRVLAIHSIRQFLLHFPSGASPCAITVQLDSNFIYWITFPAHSFAIHVNSRLSHLCLNVSYFYITYLEHCFSRQGINPLKTKRRLLYLKTQSVPRCKHFSFRL